MRIFALAARSFARSVQRAAGVVPLTFPPASMESFNPGSLEGCDLLYLKLHGLKDQPYLYGDDWITALSAEQVQRAPLRGAVVFGAVCHLAGSPMMEAFFRAGARAVIAGPGPNYGYVERLAGVDLLGWYFCRALVTRLEPGLALKAALLATGYRRPSSPADAAALADTLQFAVYRPTAAATGAEGERDGR